MKYDKPALTRGRVGWACATRIIIMLFLLLLEATFGQRSGWCMVSSALKAAVTTRMPPTLGRSKSPKTVWKRGPLSHFVWYHSVERTAVRTPLEWFCCCCLCVVIFVFRVCVVVGCDFILF